MRSIVSICLSFLVIGALIVNAHAAGPRYSIAELRVVSTAVGAYTEANAINDNGVVVGNERGFDPIRTDEFRPVVWVSPATPSLLPTLGSQNANAMALNNSGLIVGYTDASPNGWKATIFGNTATAITGASYIFDVNDSGVIVGKGGATGNFRLATATNQFQSLGTTLNQSGWSVECVSRSGRMYGNNYTSAVYPGELFLSTAPVRLYSSQDRGAIVDVNASEVGVGWTSPSSGGAARAALFSNGTITPVVVPNSGASAAMAVNDRGIIVLNANVQSVFGAYVWESGTAAALSSRIDNGGAWSSLSVIDINNRGQIIGQGRIAGRTTCFRLDPIRSPGDTNYDNTVNYADLLTLVQNYNRSGNGTVFWETGDFNFDWVIDATDRLTMSQNYYNRGLFEADWARAVATIPEPSILVFAAALISLVRRQRA